MLEGSGNPPFGLCLAFKNGRNIIKAIKNCVSHPWMFPQPPLVPPPCFRTPEPWQWASSPKQWVHSRASRPVFELVSWRKNNILNIHMYIYTYIHSLIYWFIHLFMHACMHACMYVCMYVCMYCHIFIVIHFFVLVYPSSKPWWNLGLFIKLPLFLVKSQSWELEHFQCQAAQSLQPRPGAFGEPPPAALRWRAVAGRVKDQKKK